MTDVILPVLNGFSARARDLGDGTFAGVVSLPGLKATAISANTAFDATNYGDVEFQFAGAGPVTVTRSLDGVLPYVSWPIRDKNGSPLTSAASADIYSVRGGGFLQFSAAVTVRGGN